MGETLGNPITEITIIKDASGETETRPIGCASNNVTYQKNDKRTFSEVNNVENALDDLYKNLKTSFDELYKEIYVKLDKDNSSYEMPIKLNCFAGCITERNGEEDYRYNTTPPPETEWFLWFSIPLPKKVVTDINGHITVGITSEEFALFTGYRDKHGGRFDEYSSGTRFSVPIVRAGSITGQARYYLEEQTKEGLLRVIIPLGVTGGSTSVTPAIDFGNEGTNFINFRDSLIHQGTACSAEFKGKLTFNRV